MRSRRRADTPAVEVLGAVPGSGHPHPSRCDLVVQAVLAGWEERCGQEGSLDWLRVRAGAHEPLAPLDWSTGYPSGRCPGHGLPREPRCRLCSAAAA